MEFNKSGSKKVVTIILENENDILYDYQDTLEDLRNLKSNLIDGQCSIIIKPKQTSFI